MIDEDQLEREREELAEINEQGPLKRFVWCVKRSGPGWLQGAITLGGGSLAGALYLGVISGYEMMWIQPLAMICGVIMLLAISYVTLSTGERPFGMINRNISPALGWAWLIATLMANVVWCMPQYALGVAAIQQNLMPGAHAEQPQDPAPTEAGKDRLGSTGDAAETAELAPDEPEDPDSEDTRSNGSPAGKVDGSPRSTAIICGCLFFIALVVNFFYESGSSGIRIFERILKVMVGIVVVSFFAVVGMLTLKGALPWGEIARGFVPDFQQLFRPAAVFESLIASSSLPDWWTDHIKGLQQDRIITAFATAVGINMTFLLPYSLLRKGWGKEHRGMAKVDLSIGLIVPFVLATGCVLIASASQFHGKTGDVLDSNGNVVPSMEKAYASVWDKRLGEEPEVKEKRDVVAKRARALAEIQESIKDENDPSRLQAQADLEDAEKALAEIETEIGDALPFADKQLAAMVANRDNFNLANALTPLANRFVAQFVFGVGVLGMALSTIIILMLINGFTLCEMFGTHDNKVVHLFGCLIAGVGGIAGPYLWNTDARAALAIPTSVIGGALIPIAYYTFFLMMNSRRILGDDMPRGVRWVFGNCLMLTATGVATFASIWVLWAKAADQSNLRTSYIATTGLIVLAILFVVGTLGFLAKNTSGDQPE